MLRRVLAKMSLGRVGPYRPPQALIIGAQKGGTSALASYLAQHPRLTCAKQKEVEFFGSDLRYARGLRWYADHWPQAAAETMRFEASPQYLFSPQAARRIYSCLPATRLIAILRDPVHRAFSAWQMYRRQLADDPTFYRRLIATHYTEQEGAAFVPRTPAELDDFHLAVLREVECIERGQSMEWSVVELGLYGPQLRRYFDLFPAEQLLVLEAGDLRSKRVKTLNSVLRFLAVEPWNWSSADLSDVFVGNWSSAMPTRTSDYLSRYYRASNRMLEELIDRAPTWARHSSRRRAA